MQSKPVLKKKMITEGTLALFTMIVIVSIIEILVPLSIIYFIDGKYNITAPIVTILIEILIRLIVGAIALNLSISLKDKAFIDIMFCLFSTGSYMLFGLSAFLKVISESKIVQVLNIDKSSKLNIDKGIASKSNMGTDNDVNSLYDKMADANSVQVYDVIKWIDPSSHWGRMFWSIIFK
ncbi:hypothetical protein [Candidatus Mycoplasma mahonii]|uniref:hypothetical protein n=1 Tax=Candidatus Mycoplasma mahonii TaxID=3004105 RepID=UPI0026EBE522|nr:hypothetical protein [Candidatus Mycoplasma mahonii]WKX02629.1 hypothetical protein O3I44_00940 [Candidatus Mycoplasma mahonii]